MALCLSDPTDATNTRGSGGFKNASMLETVQLVRKACPLLLQSRDAAGGRVPAAWEGMYDWCSDVGKRAGNFVLVTEELYIK